MPEIVAHEEWLAANQKQIEKEKTHTRARDALNAERRRLPMWRIEKDYVFDGPGGKAGLLDLFEGRRQLVLYHFMFGPNADQGCDGCSMVVDNMCHPAHLHARDINLALVSRAPLAKIDPFKKRMGWNLPWYSSFMMPLTEATLGEGLNDLAVWRDQGFEGKLAINLSPTLFRQADLIERLLEQFRYFNMSPSCVDLEVTESGIMEQPNKAVNMLTAIRDQGCRVSVDDFGTGHSSLAYLADLPIDTIKIDKYFVQNLYRPWGEAIVGAAATLADKLGLTTVAEGIEEESQYRKRRELGITQGQGFYIGHPMFKHDFHEWLQNKTTPTRSFQQS